MAGIYQHAHYLYVFELYFGFARDSANPLLNFEDQSFRKIVLAMYFVGNSRCNSEPKYVRVFDS